MSGRKISNTRIKKLIHHYKLTLQYKGTNYLGWQLQPEKYGKTIQLELNNALKEVSKSEQVRTLGSGRTDAGVHALGQIVKASILLKIEPQKLIPALNVKLPDDIKVISSEFCDEKFMPTVNAISKEYNYRFTSQRFFSPLQNDLIANYPFDLDINKMISACELLIGEHDFVNYFTEGTDVSSTVRTIFSCSLEEVKSDQWSFLPAHYNFKIVGNGFLKQMVRMLVGVVWNIGRGKVTIDEFKHSLMGQKMERLAPVAPPNGLYLVCVNY